MVNAGIESCVSITPDQKNGRAYYMGTVTIKNASFRIHQSGVKRSQKEQVRNVHAWAVGDLDYELTEQYRPTDTMMKHLIGVTYHYNSGRFIAFDGTDVTDGTYRAAFVCGRDFYITKEW